MVTKIGIAVVCGWTVGGLLTGTEHKWTWCVKTCQAACFRLVHFIACKLQSIKANENQRQYSKNDVIVLNHFLLHMMTVSSPTARVLWKPLHPVHCWLLYLFWLFGCGHSHHRLLQVSSSQLLFSQKECSNAYL